MYESNDEHEFLARLPIEDANTLDSEFRFIETEASLDLPAAVVTEHNSPSISSRANRIVGEQEPGLATRARSRDNHPKGLVGDVRQLDGKVNDASFAFAATSAIIDHAMINRAFLATDLRSFVSFSVFINQVIALFPTHDETHSG